MPKIISANFVKNEAHCIKYMLECVVPCVEESYVLIDDTTTDNTAEICAEYNCHVEYFKFENFGKTWNTLLSWISNKSDWTLFIAPDETLEPSFTAALGPLVSRIHTSNLDGVWFPRRHWEDIERKVLFEKDKLWFPDRQLRLLRNDYPRIHAINYVHEWMVGLRNSFMVKEMVIHHHNAYWKPRINYNWDKMNDLYNKLAADQKVENGSNVWPN